VFTHVDDVLHGVLIHVGLTHNQLITELGFGDSVDCQTYLSYHCYLANALIVEHKTHLMQDLLCEKKSFIFRCSTSDGWCKRSFRHFATCAITITNQKTC